MATITLPISLSASINVQADDDHGGLRDIEWIPDLSTPTQQGFYGNRAEKVIFYRDKTQSADSSGNYWVVWQDGKSVEQMERVRWDKDHNAWYKWNNTENTWAIDPATSKRSMWSKINNIFNFTPAS